jgi:rhodanese-related sulfurtransferase
MNRLFGIFPKPSPMKAESRVYDLKERLDWGEPALSIVDVRDRSEFNHSHITGAISIPATQLVSEAPKYFEIDRDIYLYGNTDDETVAVADQLKAAGYANVSVLRGGVAAWKAAGFPIESITAVAA